MGVSRVELFLTEQIRINRWVLLCIILIASIPFVGILLLVVSVAYNVLLFFDNKWRYGKW